ncbi:glycerophosphodiester phosphodiesterase family protein [Verrucomicrobiota bacterium]
MAGPRCGRQARGGQADRAPHRFCRSRRKHVRSYIGPIPIDLSGEESMRIAVCQPTYPAGGTVAGAEKCLRWMRTRLDGLEPGQHDLVLLPEYANAPGLSDRQVTRRFANHQGATFLEEVAASAKRLNSLIVLSAFTPAGSRWFNRSLVYDASGDVVSTYDKIHLTDAEREELGLTPGAGLTILERGGVRISFATCFDLYFPEHFGALAALRADLVLCPSYQRSESAERIGIIAQARAIDSGAYVIRSSYAMGDVDTGGRSLVVAPDGTVLADAGKEACVIEAEIDPTRKFTKPACHGRPAVEHRALIEANRRPAARREYVERAGQLASTPFPWLCAHRGLSVACPENTLPAFAAAIAAGAHEIEFDVQASRDSVPVICHDEAVERTTDGNGPVAELAWDEIRSLDAGIYLGPEWAGVRMPRLEEVLALVGGRVALNVHVKDHEGAMTRLVCDLLRERALTDMAYLALGSEAALEAALDYAPDIPRACLLNQDNTPKLLAAARKYRCRRVQFSRQATPAELGQAREAGYVCNLFWSDEPEDAMEYVRNGIDVILTNCAHTMIAGGFEAFRRFPAK